MPKFNESRPRARRCTGGKNWHKVATFCAARDADSPRRANTAEPHAGGRTRRHPALASFIIKMTCVNNDRRRRPPAPPPRRGAADGDQGSQIPRDRATAESPPPESHVPAITIGTKCTASKRNETVRGISRAGDWSSIAGLPDCPARGINLAPLTIHYGPDFKFHARGSAKTCESGAV